METRILKLRHKGEMKIGEVVEFQSLDEALRYLGKDEVFKAFQVGSRKLAEDALRGKKKREKKWLKLNLAELNDKQKDALHTFIKQIQSNPSMIQELHEP